MAVMVILRPSSAATCRRYRAGLVHRTGVLRVGDPKRVVDHGIMQTADIPPGGAQTAPVRPVSGTRLNAVFMALMLCVLLAALDQTIVATALPTIVGDLHGLA